MTNAAFLCTDLFPVVETIPHAPSCCGSQDALDFIDAFYAGTLPFVTVWKRLVSLGCSSYVLQAFFTEAMEDVRR